MLSSGISVLSFGVSIIAFAGAALAASSGCHRWHSCPSSTNSYVCGDLGYCSQCQDHNYCVGGQKRSSKPVVPVAPTSTASVVSTSTNYIPPPQTKTSGCIAVNTLPDSACTPGAVFNVTVKQICKSGYSKSVRDVSTKVKNQVFKEYGVKSHPIGTYEVDHLISLELGGSNDISNLWPEAAKPTPGFHEKDKVENYLHKQVCLGAISLAEAQRLIATGWLTVYRQHITH